VLLSYWFDVTLTWYLTDLSKILTEFDFRDEFVIIVYYKDIP
jgi:hypothetical protein